LYPPYEGGIRGFEKYKKENPPTLSAHRQAPFVKGVKTPTKEDKKNYPSKLLYLHSIEKYLF